jgi:hypothetical protein
MILGVLTSATKKGTAFWDVKPFNLILPRRPYFSE